MQLMRRQPLWGFGTEENKEFSEERAVRLSTKLKKNTVKMWSKGLDKLFE